ncbi:MAG: 50S ribosomal protein L34 [Bacilli bacterium]
MKKVEKTMKNGVKKRSQGFLSRQKTNIISDRRAKGRKNLTK